MKLDKENFMPHLFYMTLLKLFKQKQKDFYPLKKLNLITLKDPDPILVIKIHTFIKIIMQIKM